MPLESEDLEMYYSSGHAHREGDNDSTELAYTPASAPSKGSMLIS